MRLLRRSIIYGIAEKNFLIAILLVLRSLLQSARGQEKLKNCQILRENEILLLLTTLIKISLDNSSKNNREWSLSGNIVKVRIVTKLQNFSNKSFISFVFLCFVFQSS